MARVSRGRAGPAAAGRRDLAARSVLAGEAAATVAEVEAALAVPPDPLAAAFFDLDNTVVQGAAMFYLARGLVARRFFTSRDLVRFAWRQLAFRVRGTEDREHMHDARESALTFVEGRAVEELRTIGEEVFDEYLADKIWGGTRALAQIHLEAGQRVWLVTATPVELATTVAERLGLTGALGTVAEVVDGVYTGRLVGELLHAAAKAEAVRALAEREGLDLARCSAYSDSANDIPMLSLVGHPCAVNPDRQLRRHARRHGWEVRDYRTGRKLARVAAPTAAALGGLVGTAAGGAALRRRHR